MLNKVACIVIYVNDLGEAKDFYSDVFHLKPIWEDQHRGEVGLLFPASDTEIVLRTGPDMSGSTEVYYQVDDVATALEKYVYQGCTVLSEPFETRLGRGAVLQDPFGTRLCIQDLSKAAAQVEQI
jgi:predicted enzyme related to lactoylglutathione lyase